VINAIRHDPWTELRRHTPARIALGSSGDSLPTDELLRFGVAHAQARDAVHLPMDVHGLRLELREHGFEDVLELESAAPDRPTYLRRPDLGRQLSARSRQVPARIKDDQIGGIEMRGEPVGIDDPLLGAFEHVSLSCSLVNVYGQRLASRARSDIGKSRDPRKDRGDLSRANPPLSGAKD